MHLPNPYAQAGCNTRSIFKQSLTGFHSEFSFSSTVCYTKVKESSLPYYLFHSRWENSYLSQVYERYMKCKQPRPGFELGSTGPFSTTIAIALQYVYNPQSYTMDKVLVFFLGKVKL